MYKRHYNRPQQPNFDITRIVDDVLRSTINRFDKDTPKLSVLQLPRITQPQPITSRNTQYCNCDLCEIGRNTERCCHFNKCNHLTPNEAAYRLPIPFLPYSITRNANETNLLPEIKELLSEYNQKRLINIYETSPKLKAYHYRNSTLAKNNTPTFADCVKQKTTDNKTTQQQNKRKRRPRNRNKKSNNQKEDANKTEQLVNKTEELFKTLTVEEEKEILNELIVNPPKPENNTFNPQLETENNQNIQLEDTFLTNNLNTDNSETSYPTALEITKKRQNQQRIQNQNYFTQQNAENFKNQISEQDTFNNQTTDDQTPNFDTTTEQFQPSPWRHTQTSQKIWTAPHPRQNTNQSHQTNQEEPWTIIKKKKTIQKIPPYQHHIQTNPYLRGIHPNKFTTEYLNPEDSDIWEEITPRQTLQKKSRDEIDTSTIQKRNLIQ